jgi:hypothetical protein
MDVRWVSVVVALVGIGVGVWMKIDDGSLKNRKRWGWIGTSFIVAGVATLGVVILGMFGVQFRSPVVFDGGGLNQTAVVPSSASSTGTPTPCQVPLTKKDRERMLAFFYGQFSKSEPVKREVVKIVVGPGKKNNCPYATDLQRIFSTGGWAEDKIKIEEGNPQGAAVWFQGPLNDELAQTFFERVLCHTSQEVYHQRHPSLGVGQWQFFIGDGYGVSDYARYGISKELHEVICPEVRIGDERSPQVNKQAGQ